MSIRDEIIEIDNLIEKVVESYYYLVIKETEYGGWTINDKLNSESITKLQKHFRALTNIKLELNKITKEFT